MDDARHAFARAIRENGAITVLTGAGISAESGIPTFRGKEGFWTVGSRNYHPQEMATQAMFRRHPDAVWAWYRYRMGLCRQARPNAGHLALAAMERALGDRFTLITQNVDNLHIAAGNSPARTMMIHGNIFHARCAAGCTVETLRLPDGLATRAKDAPLGDPERRQLTCRACGGWLRPHVLWFDETYNERYYHFDSAIAAAMRTRLLITVGTAGATTLPNHIVGIVHANGGFLIDINVADNPFGQLARKSHQGLFINATSSTALAGLLAELECQDNDP